MNTQKLEKQIRIVPLICFTIILIMRQLTKTSENPVWVIITIILASIALLSFFFKIYLEKQNGTFVAKRYYIFYLFILISLTMFVVQLWQARS